ncbi:hypothetical protein RG950_002618 [Salmonella enterica]|nr:hypothetical protein [Salmonella enterica subsp. enterica serovar Enteritidis]ECD3733610.1 hypothetical protein [Salmonella enterica subsp. enterica serovar Stanley]EDU1384715.1 hypothetical protein [Salmonella enterica subsp. enterica serovar 4,[5],12:b:-]EHJ2684567.1 hypothetical protein [Salmonella enterica]EDD0862734.1 hypothetical protein [Salmonella enterica subsp. enterica serovar Stanley]
MKLYWTLKSIPELTDLPANLRNKNFKDAYNALYTHFEYWAGIVIFFICYIIFSRAYNYLFPAQLIFPYSIIRDLLTLSPGLVIWYQFIIYGVRKHYRHILERGKETGEENDSDRLIWEADTREFHQWKNVRRFVFVLSIITVILSSLILAKI